MRILLAIDGSESSETACRLVRSIHWPTGSVVEAVGVLDPRLDLIGLGVGATTADQSAEDAIEVDLHEMLDDAVARLDEFGLYARRQVLAGRPAGAIIDRANAFRAELIVLGSRRRGPLKSTIVGSVSAEVVDRAPCPVLVARRSTLRSALVAVDSSTGARRAIDFLRGSSLLDGCTVEVLTVAPPASPPVGSVLDGLMTASFEAYEATASAVLSEAQAVADEGARVLGIAGARATSSVSRGDPGHEIVEAASRTGTDLIVMGSRGHSGLTRVVLGSVARHVLLHTQTSVLIVREPVREPSSEVAEEHGATYAVAGAY